MTLYLVYCIYFSYINNTNSCKRYSRVCSAGTTARPTHPSVLDPSVKIKVTPTFLKRVL